MVRVAIVEDTDTDAAVLEHCLEQYGQENGVHFQVQRYPSACSFLKKFRKGEQDIIFMDVEMTKAEHVQRMDTTAAAEEKTKGMRRTLVPDAAGVKAQASESRSQDINGMEASHRVRELDSQVVLIFVTNLAQYAIEGYEVNALDFVLKPVNYYSFRMKIRRAVEAVSMQQRQAEDALVISTGAEKKYVPVRTLDYVEVQGHDVIYHTQNGLITVSGALKDVEKEVDARLFFRCNYCYLVNLSHVTGISGNMVTVGHDTLSVSRSRKKEFLQRLSSFYGEGGQQ